MMLKALSEKEATKQEKTRQLAKWKAADPRNVEERCILVSDVLTGFSASCEPLQNRH